jgi:hypothetical protein
VVRQLALAEPPHALEMAVRHLEGVAHYLVGVAEGLEDRQPMEAATDYCELDQGMMLRFPLMHLLFNEGRLGLFPTHATFQCRRGSAR